MTTHNMKALSKLLLLSSLTFVAVGCGASSSSSDEDGDNAAVDTANFTQAREVRSSNKPEHGGLSGLWNVRGIENDQITLRIYEMSGGDPAMNGNMLYLGAVSNEHGVGGFFDLGINVSSLESAETTAPGKLLLKGKEDVANDQGDIASRAWEATVDFTVDDEGGMSPTIKVEKDSARANEVVASTIPGEAFLEGIYDVRMESPSSESGVVARVYSQSGGDPAMNGVNVFVTIQNFPEVATFDLGINVAGVTKISFPQPTELRIEGSEDTMGPDGNVVSRPYTYSASFTLGPDGVPTLLKLIRVMPNG